MLYHIKKNALFILICFLFACNQDSGKQSDKLQSGEEKCKYGTPVAVFSKDLEKVINHQFNIEGQKGIETVLFENDIQLELIQTGCNEIRQSYSFTLDKSLKDNDSFWVQQAVEQFRYLSLISDNHSSYTIWAGAISQASESISLGETFEPEPNTFIKIDRIPSGDHNLLIITLERKG